MKGRKTPNQKGFLIMKTVDVVKMEKGYHVTRRYCGQNKGSQFFPFGKTKKDRKAAEEAKDAFVKAWEGE